MLETWACGVFGSVVVMAKQKKAQPAQQAVTGADIDALLGAVPQEDFDSHDWHLPVALPTPKPMDVFRLRLIDHAPAVLATTGPGWASRRKAAAIARAIARTDPAVTLRTYRGTQTPRRAAGRYETLIRPTEDGHSWQIAARYNPTATWPTRTGDNQ